MNKEMTFLDEITSGLDNATAYEIEKRLLSPDILPFCRILTPSPDCQQLLPLKKACDTLDIVVY